MRYIKGLTKDTIKLLTRIYKQSKYYQVRQRSHCILLSAEKYRISELMEIFKVSRNTIYNWFNNWESLGLVGLYNREGQGRKKIFDKEQQKIIKNWVKETPKNLSKVQEKIKTTWGIKVSKDTIKRVLKSVGMKWLRLRKRVSGQPEKDLYERKKQILAALKKLSDQGTLDLRYLDETGFSLTPCVPYGWQESGEKQSLASQQSKRLNVLGLLNRDNQLESYIFECKINSDIVIKFLDRYVKKVDKLTVVVIDNAPIHRSKAFQSKIEEWKQKKLEIFWLPTYSPKLNLIEILWRFMKYEWVETSAYSSWKDLVEYVEKVLRDFGTKYTINFA
ncbi:MAG: IS630 family transposase [Xenococcaceae cyanobacterium]